MSRIEAISTEPDYQELAKSQECDPELLMLQENGSSLRLEKVRVPGTNITLTCDVSMGKPRPFVPTKFRRVIFEKLHNLSHPGAQATTRLVTDRFVWPSVRKDCRAWSRACQACQRCKITRHNFTPLGNFDVPTGRFIHVHIDVIGPLSICGDYRYCLTAIDGVTRWSEVWPMRSITAEEVCETFIREWVSRFGVPSIITTDQGAQFESDVFRKLMHHFATKRNRTTSYHPCANGMIERVHRQLKAALMCHQESWLRVLPYVLLGMRTAFKEDLKGTVAEMLYGEPLRGEMLATSALENYEDQSHFILQLRDKLSKLRPIPAARHADPRIFVFKDLKTASHVFLRDDSIRRPLQPPYIGPYQIVDRASDGKTITIAIKNKNVAVSVDGVKPAFVEHFQQKLNDQTPQTPTPLTITSTSPLQVNGPDNLHPIKLYTTRSGRCVKFRF